MIVDPATAPADREGVFLRGEALPKDAGRDGSKDEWAASARAYLARAVSGASGAATVRVSVAALSVLLAWHEKAEGRRHG